MYFINFSFAIVGNMFYSINHMQRIYDLEDVQGTMDYLEQVIEDSSSVSRYDYIFDPDVIGPSQLGGAPDIAT